MDLCVVSFREGGGAFLFLLGVVCDGPSGRVAADESGFIIERAQWTDSMGI